jgi:hypothetical protein
VREEGKGRKGGRRKGGRRKEGKEGQALVVVEGGMMGEGGCVFIFVDGQLSLYMGGCCRTWAVILMHG